MALMRSYTAGHSWRGSSWKVRGAELEEWIYGTREYLASQVRRALIDVGEETAAGGEFKEAAAHAERAYLLSEAPPPDPEELMRLYSLLLAGDNRRAVELQREAQAYDLTFSQTLEEAREQFRQPPVAELLSPGKLPTRGTSFFGRELELADLTGQLRNPEHRLITLTGSGGVGKTRLALQLAYDQLKRERFRDGVYFVPLDALTSPTFVASHIAEALDLSLHGNDEPRVQLLRYLQSKQLLLVLDNFEHLMEAAELASELVTACPELRLVITSRERLNLEEEWVFPIEGLSFPGDATLSLERAREFDSVQLFGERARRSRSSFFTTLENLPPIIRICQLVEGSPLGIELSAVWVKLLPLEEIADELGRNLDFLSSPARNVAERHRSIRAAFEHSWELLTPKEQGVLRKLSVFRGGFRREAAALVAEASIPVLASLVDKSLLRVVEDGRYDRHPLLYQYTEEKLAEHPEEKTATQERHGRYFLTFAEAAESKLTSARQTEWLDRLDQEHDNLRVALRWMVEDQKSTLSLRLSGALWRFWHTRGYLQEGREWLTDTLAQEAVTGRTTERAKVLYGAAQLAFAQGDFASARALGEESLDVSREVGDKRGIAESLLILGKAVFHLGDYPKGRSLLEQSLKEARAVGDKQSIAAVLKELGDLVFEQGEYDLSRSLYEESLDLSRDLGDKTGIANSLHSLGLFFKQGGGYQLARTHFEECLKVSREIADKARVSYTLLNLGDLSYRVSDFSSARALYDESLSMMRELGNMWGVGHVLNNLGNVLLIQGHPGKARVLYEECLKIRREIGDEIGAAGALIKIGNVTYQEGDRASARSLLEEGLSTSHS